MAQILNGREIATRIRDKVKEMVRTSPDTPGMAAILVGDDPASHLYVSLKEKACGEVGIRFEKFLFAADVAQGVLIDEIHKLNARQDIHGILVQLPLPTQDPDEVIRAINANKDIDGFHQESLHRLEQGLPGLVSPVAMGVMKLIDAAQGTFQTAALVCSEFFARPLITLLKDIGIESKVVHPDSQHLTTSCLEADVLIVAVGRPALIKGSMIKKGACVIDVGTTKVGDQVLGDVEFDSVEPIAGAITPVPGGVGPVTVAMLMLNVVKAFRLGRLPKTEKHT